MKLSAALVGVLCSAFAAAAPSLPKTGLVARQGEPVMPGPARVPSPLKSSCNNECLERNYFMVGCSHAHHWSCLCTEFDNGDWDLPSMIQQCFQQSCNGPEDMNSWRGIKKIHCEKEARSIAKTDVWGSYLARS
ncbi:hypothetical protein QBC40DRAFT_263983 [Triangularia verruculosa]|uniref:Extracellular membrane protein CFEM domain-containing protein n=1 Tax=Triangularia verruculosa TaxID=2587418 RepID=A0AAN6XNJ3_9PEZI|nr:hypothetical protein QBC40DRAFT_263983 [Triangularia verruculosa]